LPNTTTWFISTWPDSKEVRWALNSALEGIRPERLVFASDYPQDFTGVNTDTGKGMSELKNYIETIRNLQLASTQKEAILGATAAGLLKIK
jgi:predicted TIM-barrel fold metal-dependent hydrolase